MVHAGEYVLRREVVRQSGMVAFLDSLNRKGLNELRGYAGGGMVQGLSVGSVKTPTSMRDSGQRPLILDFGSLGQVNTIATSGDAEKAIAIVLRREALKAGRL